jgi:hypothetical protein
MPGYDRGRLNYYPRFFMDFQLRLLIFFSPILSSPLELLLDCIFFWESTHLKHYEPSRDAQMEQKWKIHVVKNVVLLN